MILSRRNRFVFVKTIKTASTSIELFLSRFAGPDDVITYLPPPDEAIRRETGGRGPQNCYNPSWKRNLLRLSGKSRHDAAHSIHHNISAAELRSRFPNEWETFLTFTIVRNPFDRAISKFFNDHKGEAIVRRQQSRHHTDAQINAYICALPDTDLTNWHLYADGDGILVKDVIRYESLADDLGKVLHKMGLEAAIELPRAKGSWRLDHRHYSEILDSRTRARIETAASRELQAFGYQWKSVGS